jgi:fumarylacetoacetase
MTMPTNPQGKFPGPYAEIDETHDPNLRSWVESANDPNTDFPIQNLPLMVGTNHGRPDCFTRIGDRVLSIGALLDSPKRLLDVSRPPTFGTAEIQRSRDLWDEQFPQLAHGSTWRGVRAQLSRLLTDGDRRLSDDQDLRSRVLLDPDAVTLTRFNVPNYTDFYASIHHATNVGTMFRPDNALLPNYKHIPIGYHGRASSIVPSGTWIHRPIGQLPPPDADPSAGPGFGPCKLLDYELEMGCVIGRGNALGSPISIADAEAHIFGLCLVNDWSARDMQKWEYVPLGPFLAKSFATTISPYIVTMEALAPFRIPAYERPASDPRPLPYLTSDANTSRGGFDITLEVHLQSAEMAKRSMAPVRLSKGNFKHMYWTLAQMVTHHSSNGCNLQPGDLLASGTISGPTRDSRGSMLELTWDGDPFATPPKIVPGSQRTPIELPTGEKRTFIADGDTIIMKAYCEREGFRRIGFGECRGTILPART